MSFFPHLAAPHAPPLWSGEGVAADTMLATPRGPVAAGTLAVGDAVVAPGGLRRVVAGLRRMALAGAMFRRLGLAPPVLIAAGALGLGRPARDLVLGPAQPVRLGGHAVPAAALVDGVTIHHFDGDAELVVPLFDRPGAYLAAGAVLAPRPSPHPAALAEALLALPRLGDSGPLDGHVDHADRHAMVGWARDAALPKSVVPLEIVAEGQVIARFAADQPRPDLPQLGQVGHGFAVRFPTPLPAGRAWLLAVRHAGGGAPLPGSPLLIDAAGATPDRFDLALAGLPLHGTESLAGLIDRAVGLRFG